MTTQQKIKRYLPIDLNGLTFYPITVENYQSYQSAKQVLLMRMSALPVKYAVKTYLEALWLLDIDNYEKTGSFAGYIGSIIRLLRLALRLGANEIDIVTDTETGRDLKALQITQNGKTVTLKPIEFMAIRQLLAEQNGDELPDEADNLDIVQSEAIIAELNAKNLDYDIENQIMAVAVEMKMRKAEIYEWTIKEYTDVVSAITLSKQHLICGIGEMSGASWKGGNPAPSWCFPMKKDGNHLISMDSFQREHGDIQISDTVPTL